MAFIAAGDSRIRALLEAMGIKPEKTRRVTIDIQIENILVTVTEQYTTTDDVAALTEVVRQFKLVPIKAKKPRA
jgi:hypothetical protein